MAPRNLCNKLLHKFLVWVGLGQSAHVLEIPRRETLHLWERAAKVRGQAVYDFSAPAALVLLGYNVAAHSPVEHDQLTIDGERGLNLSGADALFQVA